MKGVFVGTDGPAHGLLNRRTEGQEIQVLAHKMMIVNSASSTCSAHLAEDAPAGPVPGLSTSAGIDKDFVISAANNLQALLCLSNLTLAKADDPDKVRLYTNLAEAKLRALGELMRPLLWNPV
jgi:hypothetical protein